MVALDEGDKAWLDQQAARRRLSMSELVREGVRLLRQHERAKASCPDDLLTRTRGLWRRGEGLGWQNRLRDEWFVTWNTRDFLLKRHRIVRVPYSV